MIVQLKEPDKMNLIGQAEPGNEVAGWGNVFLRWRNKSFLNPLGTLEGLRQLMLNPNV